jgi:hypothetical protein
MHMKGRASMTSRHGNGWLGARGLAAALLLGLGAGGARAVDEAAETKKQLLELTGGKRVKVVWNQDDKIKLYDTKVGVTEELPVTGGTPLLSVDGRRVFFSSGKTPEERVVYMYDTEKKKVTELAKGPGNSVLAVWRDPKTKKDWVYVNSTGDQGEKWDQAKGARSTGSPSTSPRRGNCSGTAHRAIST